MFPHLAGKQRNFPNFLSGRNHEAITPARLFSSHPWEIPGRAVEPVHRLLEGALEPAVCAGILLVEGETSRLLREPAAPSLRGEALHAHRPLSCALKRVLEMLVSKHSCPPGRSELTSVET